ncbi:hypothetical protein GCM10023232_29520 [Sphingosinicella ginsenosidimutans]|uniref:Porin n=1 Tax=Allosphingosinicella ginsenosidimutans TaxID=1176539 RepID=A0A5C6TSV1_9SPHN|nr:hypothetical protein [Sphingosinicella ginsenosidimutans]TXC63269.1 hypothetical protein FRZ32_06090 [Sphingosinicella ginsenosidimutans]
MLKKARTNALIGGGTLIAAALLLAPALAATGVTRAAPRAAALNGLAVSTDFTPAVTDPRLAAALARRGMNVNDIRFTPSSSVNQRLRAGNRVSLRLHDAAPTDPIRAPVAATVTSSPTITPSNYNLGLSVGWRRFAVSGDIAESDNTGIVPGRREAAQVGVSYRANRRLTGRVAVAAERNEGTQRLVAVDESYSLDAGAAFSITRHVDLTAGARYRIARDRIDPLSRDARRDSQTVYIGTAFHF